MTPKNNRNKKRQIREPSRETSNRISVTENVSSENYQKHCPIFSLQYLSTDSKFSFDSCNKNQKVKFADTLYRLSRLTWSQILQAHRHALGTEKISRESIKSPIPQHITDDVNFLAFRFDDKAPIVGYRGKDVFHVIWIDKSYKLYDHS